MTQLQEAKIGRFSAQLKAISRNEQRDQVAIREGLCNGRIIIPYNKKHRPRKLCAIGEGLTTKVNANIGTSVDLPKMSTELKKLKIAISAGADTVMDLSTAGNTAKIRKHIIQHSAVPVGTVPIYEAAIQAAKKSGTVAAMSEKRIIEIVEEHAKDGADFFTLHCGITRESVRRLKNNKRITGIISRGGAILVEWIIKNKKENPLYKYFDHILDIARRYDVSLSLGDGMRPGCLADATDGAQIQELILLGELAQRARKKGVQVMIEGPGHLPLNQIQANVLLAKTLCHGAPLYVLGPLVTDVTPGYDHINAAIGAAIAAASGADFLCYVTASEHLRLPTKDDVREGVIATRIAAHAADIAKGVKTAILWDKQFSLARKHRDWKKQFQLAIDPERPRKIHRQSKSHLADACTMCGEYCSLKLNN